MSLLQIYCNYIYIWLGYDGVFNMDDMSEIVIINIPKTKPNSNASEYVFRISCRQRISSLNRI